MIGIAVGVYPSGGGDSINEPTKYFYIIGENSGCFEESGELVWIMAANWCDGGISCGLNEFTGRVYNSIIIYFMVYTYILLYVCVMKFAYKRRFNEKTHFRCPTRSLGLLYLYNLFQRPLATAAGMVNNNNRIAPDASHSMVFNYDVILLSHTCDIKSGFKSLCIIIRINQLVTVSSLVVGLYIELYTGWRFPADRQ